MGTGWTTAAEMHPTVTYVLCKYRTPPKTAKQRCRTCWIHPKAVKWGWKSAGFNVNFSSCHRCSEKSLTGFFRLWNTGCIWVKGRRVGSGRKKIDDRRWEKGRNQDCVKHETNVKWKAAWRGLKSELWICICLNRTEELWIFFFFLSVSIYA